MTIQYCKEKKNFIMKYGFLNDLHEVNINFKPDYGCYFIEIFSYVKNADMWKLSTRFKMARNTSLRQAKKLFRKIWWD